MSGIQRLADYLRHILEAVSRIDSYTAGLDRAGFLGNPQIQDAVIRNLEIIGEASRNIEKRYPEFATAHSEMPFAFAYQMRNAVAHGYFEVDLEIVWNTVKGDLPKFARQIENALMSLTF
jgi:uncharacterized protein with HEPN domain